MKFLVLLLGIFTISGALLSPMSVALGMCVQCIMGICLCSSCTVMGICLCSSCTVMGICLCSSCTVMGICLCSSCTVVVMD